MKHLIRTIIWLVIAVYAIVFIVPKIPWVQKTIAEKTQTLLSEKLGTKVSIGNIDIRFPNRIIIDQVYIYDQAKKEMLRTGRMAATIDLLPLLESRYSISAVQLFGTNVNIYHKADSTLNCQFVIDSLSSTEKSSTPLDLHITSIIIRNGAANFDSIGIKKLSSHIVLNRLTDDSLNVTIKRTSFIDNAGMIVKELNGNIWANFTKSIFNIPYWHLKLPSSEINLDRIHVSKNADKKYDFDGSIYFPQLSLDDFTPILSSYGITIPDILQTIKLEGKINVEKTSTSFQTALNLNSKNTDEITISASATSKDNKHDVLISRFHVKENILSAINDITKVPNEVLRLGNVDARGRLTAEGDVMHPTQMTIDADAQASRIGSVDINGAYKNDYLKLSIKTPNLNLKDITKKSLGKVVCDLNIGADIIQKDEIYDVRAIKVEGKIPEITIQERTYRNISLNSRYDRGRIKGLFAINDPKARTNIDVDAQLNKHSFQIYVPKEDKSGNKKVSVKGIDFSNILQNIHNLTADITNTHFVMNNGKEVDVDNIHIKKTSPTRDSTKLMVSTDFVQLELSGAIDFKTLPYSIANIVSHHLPSAPGLPKEHKVNSNYYIDAHIKDLHTIKQFVDIPLEITRPIDINGYVNDKEEQINIAVDAPVLRYNDIELTGTHLSIWTPEDGIHAALETLLNTEKGRVSLNTVMKAADDKLQTEFSWDNMRENIFRGTLSVMSEFYPALGGGKAMRTNIPISHFEVGDTLWSITSKGVEYHDGKLSINNLVVGNENQSININGIASKEIEDSMTVNLHNINVRYITDLVNFNPKFFDGYASGQVTAHSVFSDLVAKGHLDVAEFKFNHGDFGTLHADASYSNLSRSIDIDAVCIDEGDRRTKIDGFISPQENTIDLAINTHNTRFGFLNGFCKSFMKDVDLQGNGDVRLHGTFSELNLTGQLVADGDFSIIANGCRYNMPKDTIKLGINEILFDGIPIKDKDGNIARLYGGVYHNHLKRISYDLQTRTDRFLAYDFPELKSQKAPDASSLYCGVAYIDGDIRIKGNDNDVSLYGEVNAQKGTFITYNSTSLDAISSKDFISWHSMTNIENPDTTKNLTPTTETSKVTGNMRFTFLVTVHPEVKLHIIMDAITGDYIDFYGGGNLRISYYNKGAFEIFGNYGIENGIYHMTIQNLLRRDFDFIKGSIINFGGPPNLANLNLQAMYHMNSVPLSDLGIGSTFKTNNVPVNCLMNITGTPDKPLVSFSLDLPSLSSDAKQMVSSVINSDETMNQQVLYLLAIGRFYSQSTAGNAGTMSTTTTTTGTSQTSLAMQSFLSGTLSQQLNQIINGVVKNNNWSIGANVTPGTDGFSNAEYEGLLSGKMFNNRLLFNGQFGYRDNIMKNTQNFIGDFSLQYLLTPSGNISLKVYNQSNDRYFTRSSLNTQGVGIVFQKEFGK
ncbi:MAG: translocation/assembly module TamB domain-containing protein [Prevotella sp.]|nr:translocation/assembly module TamB domain-containing protein [Prevotella sp.]